MPPFIARSARPAAAVPAALAAPAGPTAPIVPTATAGRPHPVARWMAAFGASALLLCAGVPPSQAAYLGGDGRSEWLKATEGDGAAQDPDQKESERPAVVALRKGMQALNRGERGPAREHFRAALVAEPTFADAHIGLASIELGQNNPAGARRELTEAERLAPDSAAVAMAWARLYLIQGMAGQAGAKLEQAAKLAPRALVPWLELGRYRLRHARDAKGALAAYEQAAALAPRSASAHLGVGTAQAALRQPKAALAAFDQAIGLQPANPAGWLMKSRLLLGMGRQAEGLSTLDEGLARAPNAVPLMLMRARALAATRQADEALRQLDAVRERAPKSADEAHLRGELLQAMGRGTDAEAAYRRAIELAPGSALPLNNLAWLLLNLEPARPLEAVRLARRAAELSPKSSPFLDTLGWAQHKAGDAEGAARSLQQAIRLEPKVGLYHLHLAAVADAQGQTDRMKSALREALRLDQRLRRSPLATPLLAKAGL